MPTTDSTQSRDSSTQRQALARITGLITLVLAAGLMPLTASSALAIGVPQQVIIATHSVRGCPQASSCTFTATGAISDEGAIVTDSVKPAALSSPIVGTAQYVRTFHGDQGTITIGLQSMIRPTDNPDVYAEKGNWVILSATGAYAALDGNGWENGIRDFVNQSLDATYTGWVH